MSTARMIVSVSLTLHGFFLFACLTQSLVVFMSRKVFTSAAYFLDLLWADGRGHAHTINRNRKNRRETYGAGRMAPKGTLKTSLELEERCFHNSSLCLQFFSSWQQC